jgi:autotransporter-associated beta strand protein
VKTFRCLSVFLLSFLCASVTFAQLPAFPGAEGFGKYAQGGRTGTVYHVTNLNDSGTGSLRDAVSVANRIVVFDVAGVIKISSRIVFKNNLYVAGQTAPGEGIIVYGDGVSFSGASNTIVRYVKFRMGKSATGEDAAGVANGTNMMFDHLSVSWGLDETFSISPDDKGDLGDITIQNSIIGQGLLSHSAGGLIQAPNITLYRNLYVDNGTRNAKIKGINQYVNNMVYNWKAAAYIMGGGSLGDAYCNAVSNLFIKGPAGGGTPFSDGNSLFHLYADDNWYDATCDGQLIPYLIPNSEYSGGPDFQTVPYSYPILPTWSARTLADSLLPTVGASLPYRDIADHYMVDEVRSFGLSGRLLSDENQLPFGIPTVWNVWKGTVPIDTDADGMPDAWESANGTNLAVNDAMTISANGYANIENYINCLTLENRTFFLREPVSLGLTLSLQSSLTLNWLDYTENEDGFVLEMKKDGVFTEIKQVSANQRSLVIDGLTPATAYTFRARAFKGTIFSDYSSELTAKTQPVEVPVIDPFTFDALNCWTAGSDLWDLTTYNWSDGVDKFVADTTVLFAPQSPITVTINQNISNHAVVVRGTGDVTFAGTGGLAGIGSLNKAGSNVLTVGAANTYTGATVLWDGTYAFSKLDSGGKASSLGASQEFAQNWIWKGGAWKYTGSSAVTNRSATLYNETAFNIDNSSSTVTMNGTLTGPGSLVLNGKGIFRINKPFAFEGNTILKGGTLYMEGSTMIDQGLGTSPKLVMAGGTFKTKDSNDRYGVYSFPIEVVEGTKSVFYVHRNCSIQSKVSGSGSLEYQVNYLREYVKGDWSDFTGRLIANGVNATTGECQLMLLNGVGIPNAVVQTKGNLQIVCWSTTASYALGGLSGIAGTYLCGTSKNTTGSKMTWTVGGANTNETFAGVIDNRCSASGYNGSTSIVKNGDGYWRLTGTNVYSGTTTVQEGKLLVNGSHTGAGAVTVNAGATLAGTGSLTGKVTLVGAASLHAGDSIVNNLTLTLKGGLALNTQSEVDIPLVKTSATTRKANKIAVTGGTTTLSGTLNLNMDGITSAIAKDDYFDIFSFTGSTVTGTFTTISPDIPDVGLIWDTSNLYTTGRIYVREEGYVALPLVTLSDTRVYPTVTTGKITVEMPSGVHADIVLYNASGKLTSFFSTESNGTLDVSSYPNGIYFLKLTDAEGHSTLRKFAKI